MGEYRWATSQLREWRERQQTLDRIAPRCGAQPKASRTSAKG